jgi:hypothetical protein
MVLVVIVAGVSALAGAFAGGAAVYQVIQERDSLPDPIRDVVIPAGSHEQSLTLGITDIETSITQTVGRNGEELRVEITLGEAPVR